MILMTSVSGSVVVMKMIHSIEDGRRDFYYLEQAKIYNDEMYI